MNFHKSKNYQIDMTNGSIVGKLIRFSGPLIFSGILQLLFNAADIVVVGRFAGDNSLAAVGSTSSLINLLVNLFVGLSVGFASKTGLFNIGAPGQYTVGACCGLVACIQFDMPWYVCVICSAIGGAIWGIFPGLFKALFNVNEVITSIMFNWIGVYAVNLVICNMPLMLSTAWKGSNTDKTPFLSVANPEGIIPKGILGTMYPNNSYANIGIIIAIIVSVVIYVVLNKTTFGYELKACGLSQNAGIYAGIKAKRNMVLSMVIAGALAGIGGGVFYLSGVEQFTIVKAVNGMGFNGIPVALLAYNNPIGIIFSSMFIALVNVGGEKLQPDFATELIDIIIAAIIYFSAFSLLVQTIIRRFLKADESNVNAEPVKVQDKKSDIDKDKKDDAQVNEEVTK